MKVLYITDIRKRLITILLITAAWFFFFLIGSYLLDHTMLFNICMDEYFEFSYPYGLNIEKIIYNNKYTDAQSVSVFCPVVPRTEPFTNYESIEGNFSFGYPSGFKLEVLDLQGGEILYHIAFNDKANMVYGFVQVWNLEEDLGSFLQKSLTSSNKTYKYFNISKTKLDGQEGILWDYSVAADNRFIKGSEFFIKCGSKMYRLSYFVPEEKWDKKQKNIFENMLKSLKIKCL